MTERDTVTGRSHQDRSGNAAPLSPPTVGGESVLESLVQASEATVIGSSEPLAISTDGPPVSGSGSPAAGRGGKVRIGDRVFYGLSAGAAGFVIVLVMLIALFLILKSVPSINGDEVNFLTSTQWNLSDPNHIRFGLAPLLYVTIVISLVAMLFAVPIAIAIALFVTHYAPARLAKPVAYVIDLLAAIPSIIYGVWGAKILAPKLTPVQNFIGHLPGGFFAVKSANGTIFDGSIVLAIMVLPIVTAISRDVFERTPRANIEAALALGATKWEMIRMSVLPYGRAGVVSGAMLGLGRALGETIAIYLIVSTVPGFSSSLFGGGETIASKIANGSSEFDNAKTTGAYIAAGLALFVLTFLVNAAARAIVNRKKDFVA